MKKIFLFSLVSFLFLGCKSTNLVKENNSPIAIISIIGNKTIPWIENSTESIEDDEQEGFLSSTINAVMEGNSPERLTSLDRLDYADIFFRDKIEELTSFDVITKENVVKNDFYIYTNKSVFNILNPKIVATDYKDFSLIGRKNARILMDEINAKSLVSLDFTFRKKITSGTRQNGMLSAVVQMKVKILDKSGGEFINKTYESISDEEIKIVGDYYKKEDLIRECNSAIEKVIIQFILDKLII